MRRFGRCIRLLDSAAEQRHDMIATVRWQNLAVEDKERICVQQFLYILYRLPDAHNVRADWVIVVCHDRLKKSVVN